MRSGAYKWFISLRLAIFFYIVYYHYTFCIVIAFTEPL